MRMNDAQDVIEAWVRRCFGDEQQTNSQVRALRLVEEAIEFAQSVGVPVGKCQMLAEYVYARPAGDPVQELGGVAVTALAAASSLKVYLSFALHEEITRITSKPDDHFTARNQTKLDAGFK